ncbi:MAG: hypothetical protein ACOC2R_00460 [Spirochaetota bacterium]
MNTGVFRITSRIARGYVSALRACARVLAFSVVVAAISAAITLPLWYWATTHRRSFTAAVLILLAGVLIFFTLRQVKVHINNLKTKGVSTLEIILLPLKRIAKFLAALILIYITLITFTTVSPVVGIISAILSIVVIGILFFASR